MNLSLLISKDACSSLDSKDQIMTVFEVKFFYYSNNFIFIIKTTINYSLQSWISGREGGAFEAYTRKLMSIWLNKKLVVGLK